MLLCPLTNFQIWKHHQNKPKSNGVYSRNNLVLELSIFQKKLDNSMELLYEIFIEYMHIIQYFLNGFVWDLILREKIKVY